jgi:4-hydroxy-3-methylbut-2-enyl diphosphate reductase
MRLQRGPLEGGKPRAYPVAMSKPALTVLLASPRGFCAGVDRAIQIVERAIETYGAPVYVRHEIVHNRHVVGRLRDLGAIFVEELDECPVDRPVIFSAHGVPKAVPAAAARRQMLYLDATCPLVSKVHVEAQRHHDEGREILLIGHAGHPEVIGTLGQLADGVIHLIETVADARAYQPRDGENLAYVTQTTLSVDDTAEIVGTLRARFPAIAAPFKEDICYATTNRQDGVKAVAARSDILVVLGSANSSNSVRLAEVARRAGVRAAHLIDSAEALDFAWLDGVRTLGVTAGASAPEVLVEGLIAKLAERFEVTVEELQVARETVSFKLPRALETMSSAN